VSRAFCPTLLRLSGTLEPLIVIDAATSSDNVKVTSPVFAPLGLTTIEYVPVTGKTTVGVPSPPVLKAAFGGCSWKTWTRLLMS
jgi:hypothetical protein